MVKYITFIICALISGSAFAQNISGQAFYESKTTVDMDSFGGGREMSEDMKKQIAERMKSMLEKTVPWRKPTFLLSTKTNRFTKNRKNWKQEQAADLQ